MAGRYRLGERLGGGSMGVVWRGEDLVLRRTVAIKQLTGVVEGAGPDFDEAVARARREARNTARLRHPHAVTVFDVAEEDGLPWLVMEFVPGRSLAEVLRERGRLPPAEVAVVGAQVAAALAAAHLAGIVHRDVKPGNVLIADDGGAKLVDFGISRAVGDGTLTAVGLITGTPAYLAPEVANGAVPTEASDVFALGATLYAAVEGEPPFGRSENVLALLHAVAGARIRPPVRAGALTELLAALLRPVPGDRPGAAAAAVLLTRLARSAAEPPPVESTVDETVPVVAEPEPKLRPARRRRRLVLPVRTVVVAVGLLAVVVAGAMMINTPGTPHSAAPALAGPTRLTAPTRTITVVPDATDARAFLTHYYSLLPGRLDAAMGLLTGRYLAKVGGARAFRGFYATIASVRVRAVNVLTARTATAILVFHRKDGVTSVETYRFTLVVRAGTVLIDDAQLIG